MRKLTQEEYLEKCNEVHNNKYDYSLVEYKNTRSKIKIICEEHGIFEQLSKGHKKGQGCPRCYAINYNLSSEEFIKKCDNKYDYSLIPNFIKTNELIRIIDKETNIIYQQYARHRLNNIKPIKMEFNSIVEKLKNIHNNKYEYLVDDETVYSTTKIKIKNIETGDIFDYRVDRHLSGMEPNKVTINLFKIKSRKIHGCLYDYSLVNEIKGNNHRVEIICKEHGIFTQRVSNHMNLGDGCPKCVGVGKWNTKLLVKEFIKIHLDTFNYSLVNFTNIKNKVKIICKEHGIFEQNIHKHLKGQGCKFCASLSKGEDFVKNHLDEMKIEYIRQHSFDTCKYVNKLSFDFYLPEHNTCIEFDGQQHFKPIKWFGGEEGFILNVKRDECKNNWCIENNVKLLRIKYNQIDKIPSILNEELLNVI